MLSIGAHVILSAAMLLSPSVVNLVQEPAKPAAAAAAAVTIPDTPAGTALKEFIASFNAGGDKRKAWVAERTTIGEGAADLLQQDAQFLEEHGAMTVVRVPSATATKIAAIVRHAKSGAHGHLTIDVDATAPNKVTNMQLRGATPEEIKGL